MPVNDPFLDELRLPVDAVQWHEGMLLAPQHFQQSALRTEQLVSYHLRMAAPFHWGVRRLRIDPVALVNGTFRVTELEGILPDGLPVGISDEHPQLLEIDLQAQIADFRRGPLRVHLAIAAQREGRLATGTLARYLSIAGRAVSDDNTGEGELRIPRLRPRLMLLLGESPPEKFVSFPLAEVRFQDETYALTGYQPPVLAIGQSGPLREQAVAVATRMREKASFLSEKVRASVGEEKRPLLQEMQLSIRSLVGALPPLEALVSTGAVHPFELYLALSTLAGQLSGLGATQVPPVFPRYDHNDLRSSFAPLLAFANRMLDAVHESYTAVSFQEREGRFGLVIPAERLGRTLVVGVVAPPGTAESEVAEWFESAQIGSASRIASVRQRRIRGVVRRRIAVAEELGLAPSRGVVLFALTVDPDLVVADEELIVMHPADADGRRRPAELVFYVRTSPHE